jgi:type IV pilus assembly protein PilA
LFFINFVSYLLEGNMSKVKQHSIKQRGQGMTEYIIIVALIAVAAIGVYQAFGDVVRSQTSVAATTLGGMDTKNGRKLNDAAAKKADDRAVPKDLATFEKDSKQ